MQGSWDARRWRPDCDDGPVRMPFEVALRANVPWVFLSDFDCSGYSDDLWTPGALILLHLLLIYALLAVVVRPEQHTPTLLRSVFSPRSLRPLLRTNR